MYICKVSSNSSRDRIYEVETKSAMKCAQKFGRCEGGETVTVMTKKSGKMLSCVMWTPEDGGKYYRAQIY